MPEAHRNLAEVCQNYARSVKEQDIAGMQFAKNKITEQNRSLAAIWSEQTTVMAELKQRYLRDFDVID